MNLLTYGVYWWDKRRARIGGRRISERELLTWALAGGSLGAIAAMRIHRHKTRKLGFRIWFGLVLLVQVAAVVALIYSR